MMKKLFLYFLFLLVHASLGQTLTWRIANPQVTGTAPGTDSLEFDVEVRVNSGTFYIKDLNIYFDYSTQAFGSNIAAAAAVSKGQLIQGNVLSFQKYTVTKANNTSSRLSIPIATFFDQPNADPGAHNQVTTTFQAVVHISLPIANSNSFPEVTFVDSTGASGLMAIEQYYFNGTANGAQFLNSYDNDLLIYPLEPYNIRWDLDSLQWVGGSGPGGAPDVTDLGDNLLVEGDTTDPLPVNGAVKNLIILNGGTLNLGSSNLTITGSLMGFTGSNVIGTGKIIFGGGSTQTLTGNNSWTNVEINNSTGVSITSGEQVIKGVLTPTSGTLTTNGLLRCAATDPEQYAQIAPGNGTVSGNVTFEMVISTPGWHTIGSPISGATLYQLADDIKLQYNGATGGANIYFWDATTADFIAATDSSQAFGTRGWNLYIDNNFLLPGGSFPITLDISGPINDNTISFDNSVLGYADEGTVAWGNGFVSGSNNDGWNLIANPYPSNLKWDQMRSSIFNTNDYNDYFYVWDENANPKQYQFSATNNISPMQGIWVKFESDGPVTAGFDLNDNFRTTSSPAPFFKSTPSSVQIDLLEGSTVKDFVQVATKAGSSREYNPQGDAVKQKSYAPGVPSLFFVTADTTLLAVNSIAPPAPTDTLPLTLLADQGVAYTLHLEDDLFDPSVQIYLQDRKTNSLTDLRALDYSFSNDTAWKYHRFNLIFNKPTFSTLEGLDLPFPFHVKDKWCSLDLGSAQWKGPATLEVYNLAGQLVYRNTKVEGGGVFAFRIPVREEVGVYFLRLDYSKSEPPYVHKFIY